MKIKRFLILTPILVFAVLGLSLCVARQHFEEKLNQLVLSSLGDAERLNPILSTDSMSGDVNDRVFNGLIKYNENMELVPDLAESYTISQKSFCYPKSDPQSCLKRLQKALDAGTLRDAGVAAVSAGKDGAIEIQLAAAGRAYEAPLLKVLPEAELRPIHLSTVMLDTKQSLPDGQPCSASKVIEKLKAQLPPGLDVLEYFEENSGRIDIKYLGDKEQMAKALGKALTTPGEKPSMLGRVVQTRTGLFDNEPIILFKLRRGVRWHDGAEFTSADVKFTYDKIMDEKTNTVRRPMFELVKRVDTPDACTMLVTYKRPFAPCIESWSMGVIPKHLLEHKDINEASFNRKPVGTGPFKFHEWTSDEKITVVANDDYFEGRPELDMISWRIIPEAALRTLEFRTEGVDYDGVEPYEYASVSHDPRFKVYQRLSNGYTYVGWNQKKEIFADKRVRRALTMAINREEIVKYILYDLGVVATGPFPPQMWYCNPNVKPLPFDPDRAKALLAQAGWKDTDGDGFLDKNGKKFEFDLITNNGNQQRMDITVLVQRQLKNLGIDVKIALYEWSAFIKNKINPRDFEACILGWGLSYDPDIYEIWHSSQIEKGFNFTAYKNPEVDRLIEEGRTEFNREKRKQIYYRIHELIAEDQPYTFLFVGKGLPALHRGKFRIGRRNADGTVTVEDIKMTKVGLSYYLNYWFRVSATETTP